MHEARHCGDLQATPLPVSVYPSFASLEKQPGVWPAKGLKTLEPWALSRQVGTVFQPLVTYEQPPTYFATNKITSCFQEVGIGCKRPNKETRVAFQVTAASTAPLSSL